MKKEISQLLKEKKAEVSEHSDKIGEILAKFDLQHQELLQALDTAGVEKPALDLWYDLLSNLQVNLTFMTTLYRDIVSKTY